MATLATGRAAGTGTDDEAGVVLLDELALRAGRSGVLRGVGRALRPELDLGAAPLPVLAELGRAGAADGFAADRDVDPATVGTSGAATVDGAAAEARDGVTAGAVSPTGADRPPT